MARQYCYFKLTPPRPTFPADMTNDERVLMEKHSVYFREAFQAGKLLLYGPVMAPEGAFGVAILEVEDEAEARQFGENDPSVRAGMNRFQICPMHVTGARATI